MIAHALEDSIEMLCLPLGCSNPGKGCRRNQSEYWRIKWRIVPSAV